MELEQKVSKLLYLLYQVFSVCMETELLLIDLQTKSGSREEIWKKYFSAPWRTCRNCLFQFILNCEGFDGSWLSKIERSRTILINQCHSRFLGINAEFFFHIYSFSRFSTPSGHTQMIISPCKISPGSCAGRLVGRGKGRATSSASKVHQRSAALRSADSGVGVSVSRVTSINKILLVYSQLYSHFRRLSAPAFCFCLHIRAMLMWRWAWPQSRRRMSLVNGTPFPKFWMTSHYAFRSQRMSSVLSNMTSTPWQYHSAFNEASLERLWR